MLKTLLILGVGMVALVSARTNCTQDSQCGQDECCYYHEGPLMVSRRQMELQKPVLHLQNPLHEFQGGYCETFKKENEQCSYFGKINGHCECGAGLSCSYLSATDQQGAVSKKAVMWPGFGQYTCIRHVDAPLAS